MNSSSSFWINNGPPYNNSQPPARVNPRPHKIDLDKVQFTPELLECVPGWVARKFRVLPVSSTSDLLCIALDDPSDLDTVDSLFHILHRELTFVIAESTQLDASIRRLYGEERDFDG